MAPAAYSEQLIVRLAELEANLPEQIWDLIDWLESNGQGYRYKRSLEPFVSVYPVNGIDALWSNLAFVVPDDLVKFWFGRDGLEKLIIPFIRASADGGHIALWRRPSLPDSFVYLGSEGESFTIARSSEGLIAVLALGYEEIIGRDTFDLSPSDQWFASRDDVWPEPLTLKSWVEARFHTVFPDTAAELLPYAEAEDPFAHFCAADGIES